MNATITNSGVPTAPHRSSNRASPTLSITRSGYLSLRLHDPGGNYGDVAQAGPLVEPSQGVRRPPVGPAQQAHYRRHDERAHERRVDGRGERETDADGLDDHHRSQ